MVPLDSWGAALQYFTGSQAHNVRIREIAVRKKLKLSEYGLFDIETGALIVSRTEEDVYAGSAWPGCRRRCGRTPARSRPRSAATLPALVTDDDIRGDLHTHTDLTDGVASLEQMVTAAAGPRATPTTRSPITRRTCSCSG